MTTPRNGVVQEGNLRGSRANAFESERSERRGWRACSRWRETILTLKSSNVGEWWFVELPEDVNDSWARRTAAKQIVSLGRVYGIRVHYQLQSARTLKLWKAGELNANQGHGR